MDVRRPPGPPAPAWAVRRPPGPARRGPARPPRPGASGALAGRDPVAGAAHEAHVFGAGVGDDAEDRLVVVGARAVEDLEQQELAGLDRRALGERRADDRLHRRALPAAVLGARER